MEYYETGYLDQKDRKYIREHNLYSYGIRADDNGWLGTIEPRVIVNNCGYIVTNERIVFDNNKDEYVDYEEFVNKNTNVSLIEDLI